MRLYSGRKVNRQIERRFRSHTESRDAIVWDLDEPNGIVRCKIQGSDEYILCHYPQNWQTLPYYAKPGFAVRLIHKGGGKGFQEIFGPGRAVPSPVFGSTFPTPAPLFDGIISGMVPTAPGGGMYVAISAGTFRIDNITYTFNTTDGGTVMEADSDLTMEADSSFLLGAGTNSLLLFDAAPSIPEARYDLVVVGADGLADIVKGTASTDPVMPAIPSDHIKIAHVLILGGITEIAKAHINALWEVRLPHNLTFVLSGSYAASQTEMYCSLTDPNPILTVTATIRCQYGWPLSISYEIALTKYIGDGWISEDYPESWEVTGPIVISGTGSTVVFKYKRDETLTDPDPPGGPLEIDDTAEIPRVSIQASLTGYVPISGTCWFDLLFTEAP